MLRYYLIATVIVVAIGTALLGHRLASLRDFDVRGRPNPSMTPTVTRGDDAQASAAKNFRGDGPWVLSALPGCFVQMSSIAGPTSQLAHLIPPEGTRIRPAATLRRGNCTLVVGEHDVWVFRAGDRLRIPPEARLYDAPAGLTLVYERDGRMEIRVY